MTKLAVRVKEVLEVSDHAASIIAFHLLAILGEECSDLRRHGCKECQPDVTRLGDEIQNLREEAK